jgi:hypothetical protein
MSAHLPSSPQDTQLRAAVAKQIECYEKVLYLSARLKEETQRRQEAVLRAKEFEEISLSYKTQLTGTLERLRSLEDHRSRYTSSADNDLVELIMQKSKRLDAELQALQAKVTEVDRQLPSQQLTLAVHRAWSRLVAMHGLVDEDVGLMFLSKDAVEFCGGVLRAFEIFDEKLERAYSDISCTHLSKRPRIRLDSSNITKSSQEDEEWQAYSTQPSTSRSAKSHVFTFKPPFKAKSSAVSPRESVHRMKPQLIQATESLMEAISKQNSKLNALNKRLNCTMSTTPKSSRFPTDVLHNTALLKGEKSMAIDPKAYAKRSCMRVAKRQGN